MKTSALQRWIRWQPWTNERQNQITEEGEKEAQLALAKKSVVNLKQTGDCRPECWKGLGAWVHLSPGAGCEEEGIELTGWTMPSQLGTCFFAHSGCAARTTVLPLRVTMGVLRAVSGC